MDRKLGAAISIIILVAGLAACNMPNRRPPSNLTELDIINTAAAKTVAVLGTRVAGGNSTPLPGLATVTLTPAITLARTHTPTPKASDTPAAEGPCNQAAFVSDITIPDGATMLPNSSFTKTWELENTGSCAWNANYMVVFAGRGSAMSGAAASPVVSSGEVKHGEKVRVSVTMRAPDEAGEYEGFWMLRSPDNHTFGTGESGAAPFYVKIKVGDLYSFAENWCSAQWSSGAGDLACPLKEGDNRGYAQKLENPTLEDNAKHDGLGLLVVPQPVPGGYIVARFPPLIVPDGADFRATLGCQPGANGCYVRFKVTYRVDNGDEQVLGEWNEGYEGSLTNAIKDLNNLSGRSAAFALYVYVNGAPDQAKAIWFDPRVTK